MENNQINVEKNITPVPLKKEVEPYKLAIDWALKAGLGVFVIFQIKGDIIQLINGKFELIKILYLLLTFFVFILGISWYQSGKSELDLSAYWLFTAHYKPPTDISIIATIAGIGCFIGILAYYSKMVTIFGIVYLFYLVVDLCWWYVRRKNYIKAIKSAQKYIETAGGKFPGRENVVLRGIAELEIYYLKRPHYLRCLIAIGLASLGVIVSLCGKFIGENIAKIIAYIIFMIIIIVGEFIIQYWRVIRDRKLLKLKTELEFGTDVE